MAKALEQYLSGTGCYFGNIYIMRREIFFNYCEWLFPILEVFDQQADTYNYNDEEKRVDGYLAERLLGGYVTFQNSKIRTLELPRVHFHNGMEYVSKQMLNIVLPPGSWRRSAIKLKRIRGRTE